MSVLRNGNGSLSQTSSGKFPKSESSHLQFGSMLSELVSHREQLAVIVGKKARPDRYRFLGELRLWLELDRPSQEDLRAACDRGELQERLQDPSELLSWWGMREDGDQVILNNQNTSWKDKLESWADIQSRLETGDYTGARLSLEIAGRFEFVDAVDFARQGIPEVQAGLLFVGGMVEAMAILKENEGSVEALAEVIEMRKHSLAGAASCEVCHGDGVVSQGGHRNDPADAVPCPNCNPIAEAV